MKRPLRWMRPRSQTRGRQTPTVRATPRRCRTAALDLSFDTRTLAAGGGVLVLGGPSDQVLAAEIRRYDDSGRLTWSCPLAHPGANGIQSIMALGAGAIVISRPFHSIGSYKLPVAAAPHGWIGANGDFGPSGDFRNASSAR
jgi:hypothetical protein